MSGTCVKGRPRKTEDAVVVGSSSGFALCFFRSCRIEFALDARSSSLAERTASLSEVEDIKRRRKRRRRSTRFQSARCSVIFVLVVETFYEEMELVVGKRKPLEGECERDEINALSNVLFQSVTSYVCMIQLTSTSFSTNNSRS